MLPPQASPAQPPGNQIPPDIPGETPENTLQKEVRLYRYDGGKGLNEITVRTTQDLRDAIVNGFREKPPPEFVMELLDWQVADNLATLLFDKEGKPLNKVNPDLNLGKIAQRVLLDYAIDDRSRESWKKKVEAATKLALLEKQIKTSPWPNASNVKYPLITTACLQYGARAYGEVIKGNAVVKAKVVGDDPQGIKAARAKRIGKHMSWQVLDETEGWEEGMDKLVHVLPNKGKEFKKVFWDPAENKLIVEVIRPEDLVVHDDAVSLDKARRITHVFKKFKGEATEYMRLGIWREIDLGQAENKTDSDEDAPHTFYEQACWFDLDGDDYPEPYYVTVHHETQEVVKITARWEPEGVVWDDKRIIKIRDEICYVEYTFLPSPDGSFYGVGFGTLLGPVNETVNTIINQLIDAGTLGNAGGGFIAGGAGLDSGEYRIRPGVWQKLKGWASGASIKDNLVPYPVNPPSPVLFQLLDFLILGAKEMSSTSQLLTGMGQAQNVNPTVILAMLEQGLKVYSTIHKRLYRSLQTEFRMIYRLNSRFLNPELYQRVLDSDQALQANDYKTTDLDILPVADPSISSETIRMAKAQALLPLLNDPGVNRQEILQFYGEGLDLDGIDRYIKPTAQIQEEQKPMAMMQLQMLQLQAQGAALELRAKQAKIMVDMASLRKTLAEITNIDAKTLGEIAAAMAETKKEGEKSVAKIDELAGVMKALEMKEKQEAGNDNPDGGMGQGGPPEPGSAGQG